MHTHALKLTLTKSRITYLECHLRVRAMTACKHDPAVRSAAELSHYTVVVRELLLVKTVGNAAARRAVGGQAAAAPHLNVTLTFG